MTPLRREFLKHLTAGAAFPLLAKLAPVRAATAAPPRIKIGQIGVGHAHASKLSVYRASPDYEVVGIVEEDEALRARAQSQPVYRDLPWLTREQLLNVPGLQAVLVETRVRDSLANAQACVDAGQHVHLDKPAGESLAAYRHVLDTAAKKNLLVQMGYMFRYNPAVLLLHDFLKRGWLGEVFEVHTVMSKVVSAGERKALAEYPGGIMFELGCHVIDLVVGVLGKPEKVTAFPRRSSNQSEKPEQEPNKLVDNMLAVFEYEKATATVRSSALEVEGFARRHLVVCGTEGTFHIQPLDNPSARVALSKPHEGYKKGYQDITFPKYARYVGDAADMAKIIRGEKKSDFPYDHDLAVQTAVLEASGLPATLSRKS